MLKKSENAVFALVVGVLGLLTVAACPTGSNSEDRTVCSEDADCEDDCAAIATSDGGEVQSFICKPERCSCGVKITDKCFAMGGVVGRIEVSCPATEEVVGAQVDVVMKNAEESEGE